MEITLKKRGKQATPKNKPVVMITVRVNKELHKCLCGISAKTNTSLNRICIDSLENYIIGRVFKKIEEHL